MDSTLKRIVFWVVMIAVAVAVYQFTRNLQTNHKVEDFSQFLLKVQQDQVKQVTLIGPSEATYETANGLKFRTVLPVGGAQYEGLTNDLVKRGVEVRIC